MPRADRNASQVVVISWRDIPAQVNGQTGRDRHQVLLSAKFQRAIDRAKRKARITTAQEDVAQWRRTTLPAGDDPAAAADSEAARLEEAYEHAPAPRGQDRLRRRLGTGQRGGTA